MTEREDRILERILQEMENPGLEDPGLDLGGAERQLWREYRELAGLLPYALEPQVPRAGLKEEILARARAETAGEEARGVDEAQRVTASSPAPQRRRPARDRGLRLMAAVLAVATLGLAVFSGWLLRDHQLQLEQIARLEAALVESARSDRGAVTRGVALDDLATLMASAGSRICPLRPWGDTPVQPVARGAVYFHPENKRWLLTAKGLEPCEQGSRYVVWFLVDGEAVAAGSFAADGVDPIIFSADAMPEGMDAVLLTQESEPEVTRPTGPTILYGSESREML